MSEERRFEYAVTGMFVGAIATALLLAIFNFIVDAAVDHITNACDSDGRFLVKRGAIQTEYLCGKLTQRHAPN